MSVITTTVTKIGGKSETYKVLPATIVAFEKQFSCALGDAMTMEKLYWLAWKAEDVANTVAGKTRQLFEDWLNGIEDVDQATDAVPTAGAATPS